MLFVVAVMMIMAPVAFALDTSAMVNIKNSGDPCLNPNVAKSSAVISFATSTLGTAATGTVITGVTSKSIYVCNIATTLTGTSASLNTFKLISGTTTTTACDVSAATLTGLMGALGANSVAGVSHIIGYGGTILKTTASHNLCTTTTGSLTGTITYVQQ